MEEVPKPYRRMLGESLIHLGRPEHITCTLDLMTPEGREQVLLSGRKLKEKGAEVIALACTGLATIGIARELEEATGLPVIDPVLAEGLFAYFESVRR